MPAAAVSGGARKTGVADCASTARARTARSRGDSAARNRMPRSSRSRTASCEPVVPGRYGRHGSAAIIKILRRVIEGAVWAPEAVAEGAIENTAVRNERVHPKPRVEAPSAVAGIVGSVATVRAVITRVSRVRGRDIRYRQVV